MVDGMRKDIKRIILKKTKELICGIVLSAIAGMIIIYGIYIYAFDIFPIYVAEYYSEDNKYSVKVCQLGMPNSDMVCIELEIDDFNGKRIDKDKFWVRNDGYLQKSVVKSLEFGSSSVKVAVQGNAENIPIIHELTIR